ncbi:hypothetical protein BM528_12880 [Alteromonas sp. RW2A1]|uniref:hypothetical protein n=1 Tax=Alteromonas sp. RW2A1 TaxID=1917158 RepID=UPI000904102A|nr:hypothetical protein BM528_12880 [Alteromonas sp. RW2A1]
MSKSVLSSVDQRTKLVGENRLELLMFQLGTRHIFAMNVFKIKEVIKGKRIKWLILPLHESETDRHLIGLSG